MTAASDCLSVQDHNRNLTGMTYVYPVVSRRAGGVSVGINLNPNNACNWRCIYCQVPNLTRGGPPPVDLVLLKTELQQMLEQLYRGDFLQRHVPAEARQVVDIAFSGNGEPTSAHEFPAVVEIVKQVRDAFQVVQPAMLRLITNGSLLDRKAVQQGIATIGQDGGEVWFKVDAIGRAATRRINSVSSQPEIVLRRLQTCGKLSRTWLQTCLFAMDGDEPSAKQLEEYVFWLMQAKDSIAGIHLYGVARPSHQPEAARLSPLSLDRMKAISEQIQRRTGLKVTISP